MALKCFDRGLNEAKTITLEDLSQTYADVRMEFNKLVSIDHQYIVKCIGFSAICMAFVLELASQGSLKTVMNNYKSSGYHLCPNSLIDTIRQVSYVVPNNLLILCLLLYCCFVVKSYMCHIYCIAGMFGMGNIYI